MSVLRTAGLLVAVLSAAACTELAAPEASLVDGPALVTPPTKSIAVPDCTEDASMGQPDCGGAAWTPSPRYVNRCKKDTGSTTRKECTYEKWTYNRWTWPGQEWQRVLFVLGCTSQCYNFAMSNGSFVTSGAMCAGCLGAFVGGLPVPNSGAYPDYYGHAFPMDSFHPSRTVVVVSRSDLAALRERDQTGPYVAVQVLGRFSVN